MEEETKKKTLTKKLFLHTMVDIIVLAGTVIIVVFIMAVIMFGDKI